MFLRKIVFALMALIVFGMTWHIGDWLGLSVAGLGVSAISGLLAFLFAVAFLLFGREGFARTPVPLDTSVLLFGVFVAVNFASIGWADRPGIAIISSINYAQLLIFVWLLAFLRSEKYAFSVLLHAYLLGVLVLGIMMVTQGQVMEGHRLTGEYDPNRSAYKFILAVPILVYLFQRSALAGYRWLYLSLVPLPLWMALLTGSRTGLLALGFVLAALAWFFLHVEKANAARVSVTRGIVLMAALGLVTVFLVPFIAEQIPRHIERFSSLADPTSSGFGNRINLWAAGIDVYLNNLLLGIGSGGGRTAILPYFEGGVYVFSFLDQPVSLHNVFLGVATDTGTVGLLLFLAMILTLVLNALSFAREERLLFLSLIGVSMIMGLTLGLEHGQEFYFVLFLSVVLAVARYPATVTGKTGEAPPLPQLRRRQQSARPY